MGDGGTMGGNGKQWGAMGDGGAVGIMGDGGGMGTVGDGGDSGGQWGDKGRQ